jgi:hypothetical protein
MLLCDYIVFWMRHRAMPIFPDRMRFAAIAELETATRRPLYVPLDDNWKGRHKKRRRK